MSLVYTYCERCAAYITIELPSDILAKHSVFPFPYTFVHGDPPHALTIYLDQDLVERGHEISEVQPEGQVPTSVSPPSTSASAPTPTPTPAKPKTAARSGLITPVISSDLQKHKLSVMEFRLLNLCDGKRSLQEISTELGLQTFACMRMVLELQKRGIVKIKKRR
ncbi:MAG: hypothetical protein ACFFDP_05295 [Promethearchaeota archaeon]